MKNLKMFIVTLLASTVSVSVFASSAADNKIVSRVIQEKLSDEEAAAILETPYDGFVEIRGKAKKDVFEFTKIKSKASYPDNRWDEVAKSIADQVEITYSGTTGSSKQKPTATAYVLFYEDGVEGVNTAGVRQVNVSDGDGDYMALLVIRQKAPRGNVSVQNSSASDAAKPSNKVYKFEVDA